MHTRSRRGLALVVVAALSTATLTGCPRGSEALFPKTRKGWGITFVVVGAAWGIAGVATAVNPDENQSDSQRITTPILFFGLSAALIALGWLIYPSRQDRAAPPPAPPPPPPPPPQPGPPGSPGGVPTG